MKLNFLAMIFLLAFIPPCGGGFSRAPNHSDAIALIKPHDSQIVNGNLESGENSVVLAIDDSVLGASVPGSDAVDVELLA